MSYLIGTLREFICNFALFAYRSNPSAVFTSALIISDPWPEKPANTNVVTSVILDLCGR